MNNKQFMPRTDKSSVWLWRSSLTDCLWRWLEACSTLWVRPLQTPVHRSRWRVLAPRDRHGSQTVSIRWQVCTSRRCIVVPVRGSPWMPASCGDPYDPQLVKPSSEWVSEWWVSIKKVTIKKLKNTEESISKLILAWKNYYTKKDFSN